MKKIAGLPLILILCSGFGQPNGKIAYLDQQGRAAKEKRATFLIEQVQDKDNLWTINVYNLFGPRIYSAQTKDKAGTIKNGAYVSYLNGFRDSVGEYQNNLMEGNWRVYRHGAANQLAWLLEYHQGVLISKRGANDSDTDQHMLPDSDQGSGLIADHPEIQSVFVGGEQVWQRFLQKNFSYPSRAYIHEIEGTVIVQFEVTKDGNVKVPTVYRSVEYSMDCAALDIIRKSNGYWMPAIQNGQHVNTYKLQSIQFALKVY